MQAKYPYSGQRSDELSFKKKEVLTLVSKLHDKGWWRCKNAANEEGLVPSTYVSIVVQEERVEKPAAVVVAASESEETRSSGIDWQRRALVAEEQLANLMKAVEEDRQMSDRQISSANERAQKAIAEADASEKKLLDLIGTLDAERAEWERVQSSASSVWQTLLEEAEGKIAKLEQQLQQGGGSVVGGGGSGSEEEIKNLKEKILQLEREKEEISSGASRMSSRWDSALEEEREEHRRTALRCTELHDMYESARRAVADLRESVAQANAENDELRLEMKELKRKTQRMVELFSKQKKEMEDEAKGSLDSSKVAMLQEELAESKSESQRLRKQLEEARNASRQRSNDNYDDDDDYNAAPSSSSAPKKWDVHVPTFMAAPPPPPPPPANAPKPPPPPSAVSSSSSSSGGPTCPKCRSKFSSFDDFYRHEPCPGAGGGLAAAISGGVALKKVTPGSSSSSAPTSKPGVVEKKPGSFGNFAELAASVAKQRQQRQEDQTQSIRPVSHRGLDDVIGQIRTSQRSSNY